MSDGDIRNHIIGGKNIKDNVSSCMNKNFKFVEESKLNNEILIKLFEQNIKVLPILLKSGKIKKFINPSVIEKKTETIDTVVRSKSPLRISLAGGGTDFTKYFFKNTGYAISMAISKYAYSTVKLRKDKKIIITSNLNNKKEIYKNINQIKYNGLYDIVKAPIKLLNPNFGFEINIDTEFKPKNGLGGSSAIASSVIGSINYFQSSKLSRYQIAECALQAERIELKLLGGWQDQYSSVFGGCNLIEFKKEENLVYNLKLSESVLRELEYRIVICEIGNQHLGSKIQKENHTNKNFIYYGEKIKKITLEIKSLLLRENFDDLGNLILEGWNLKKKTSKFMLNSRIIKMEKELLNSGASGCRLLGSGGGGFMLFYINPDKKNQFLEKVKKMKIKYFLPNFDFEGLCTWRTKVK